MEFQALLGKSEHFIHAYMQGVQRDKNYSQNLENHSTKADAISFSYAVYPQTIQTRKKGSFHCFTGLKNLAPSFSFSSAYLAYRNHAFLLLWTRRQV